jgi:hypothetical protein
MAARTTPNRRQRQFARHVVKARDIEAAYTEAYGAGDASLSPREIRRRARLVMKHPAVAAEVERLRSCRRVAPEIRSAQAEMARNAVAALVHVDAQVLAAAEAEMLARLESMAAGVCRLAADERERRERLALDRPKEVRPLAEVQAAAVLEVLRRRAGGGEVGRVSVDAARVVFVEMAAERGWRKSDWWSVSRALRNAARRGRRARLRDRAEIEIGVSQEGSSAL